MKKGPNKNNEIQTVWNYINSKEYVRAKDAYAMLSSSQKLEFSAKLALARILESENNYKEVIRVIETLPAHSKNQLAVIKVHGLNLVKLNNFEGAIKVYKKVSKDELNIDILLGKLKCYKELKNKEKIRKIISQISTEQKQLPQVVIQLSHSYLVLQETFEAEKIIVHYPGYLFNLRLCRPLAMIYGYIHQLDKLEALFKNVAPFIRNDASFLIVYINSIARIKHNISSVKEILINLVNDKKLPKYLKQKIVNILLHHPQNEILFENYVQAYLKEFPEDSLTLLKVNAKKLPKNDWLNELLGRESVDENDLRELLKGGGELEPNQLFKVYERLLEKDANYESTSTWVQYADLLTSNAHYNKAMEIYQAVILRYSKFSLAYSGAAHCQYILGNCEKSGEILVKGHTMCPDDCTIVNQLGHHYSNQKKYHKAIEVYLDYHKKFPGVIRIKTQLAYDYLRIGHLESARLLWQEILTMHSNSPMVIMGYGQYLIKANQLTQALHHFSQYKDMDDYWSTLAEPHAVCYQKNGDYQNAVNLLKQRCIKLNYSKESCISVIRCLYEAAKVNQFFENEMDIVDLALKKYSNDITLLRNIGFLYYSLHQRVLAKTYCQKILAIRDDAITKNLLNKINNYEDPISFDDITNLEHMQKRGYQAFDAKNYEMAEKIMLEIKEKYPNSRDYLNFAAQYYDKIKNISQAKYYLEKIKENFGGLVLSETLQLAYIHKKTGNIQEALNILQLVLKQSPLNIIALLEISDCYVLNFDFKQASQHCFTVLKINPKNLKATFKLAKIAHKKEDYRLALEYIDEIFSIEPNNLKAMLLKASIYKKLEQFDEAFKIILEANNLYPNNMKIVIHIFYLYYITDDLNKAKIYLDKLNVFPEHSNILIAKIRYLLTVKQGDGYNEVEQIFKYAKENHPHERIYFEYARFLKIRFGAPAAIKMLKKYLKNHLKYYPEAYQELALLYIDGAQYKAAQDLLLKGITFYPQIDFLHQTLLHVLLFHFSTNDNLEAIEFYEVCHSKFKLSSKIINQLNQMLFRANLEKYIKFDDEKVNHTLIYHFNRLNLEPNALDEKLEIGFNILTKIKKDGFEGYLYGGLARSLYLAHQPNLENKITARDIDIITNAPISLLSEIFPKSVKNKYIPNQLNLMDNNISVDINCIGAQIHDLDGYFNSLNGLTFDCLLLNLNNEIIDPTARSINDLNNNIIDFVTDIKTTCQKNSKILFRILKYVNGGAHLSDYLEENNILKPMTHELLKNNTHGKITSEVAKILKQGAALKSIEWLNDNAILHLINPELDLWLDNNKFFKDWFVQQLSQTDKMAQNPHFNLNISNPYLLAVYLIANLLEKARQNNKKGLAFYDINEIDITDLINYFFNDRQERKQLRQYLRILFAFFKYNNQISFSNDEQPSELDYPETFVTQNEDLTELQCDNSMLESEQQLASNEQNSIYTENAISEEINGPTQIASNSSFEYLTSIIPSFIQVTYNNSQSVLNYAKSFLPIWGSTQPTSSVAPKKRRRKKKKRG